MTAAAHISDLTGLDKSQQLEALRLRMETIPGLRDHAPGETEMTLSAGAPTTRSQVVEPAPEFTAAEPGASPLQPAKTWCR